MFRTTAPFIAVVILAVAGSAFGSQTSVTGEALAVLAQSKLSQSRMSSPLPCFPHWAAADDNIVRAVSDAAARAGLKAGDVMRRIGVQPLSGKDEGEWEDALRELTAGLSTFVVEVSRGDGSMTLSLPCDAAAAVAVLDTERAMWTAIGRQDWTDCVTHASALVKIFGGSTSPLVSRLTDCQQLASTR